MVRNNTMIKRFFKGFILVVIQNKLLCDVSFDCAVCCVRRAAWWCKSYCGGTATGDSAGGATGPGVCAPSVRAPGARCARAPASRPAARRCRSLRSAWTRTRRRWSPGGRGLTGRGDSSSAPCPTCRHLAPPPRLSPTTSLSTGGTGLVRVSNTTLTQHSSQGQ